MVIIILNKNRDVALFTTMIVVYSDCLGARRQRWMLFRPPFLVAGELNIYVYIEWFVKNMSSCRNKLISRLIYWNIYKTLQQHPRPTSSDGPPYAKAGRSIKSMRYEGQTAHHDDDVWGGSWVRCWPNSTRTHIDIAVEMLTTPSLTA